MPGERKPRASFGNDKVVALTDHFSNLLSDDDKEGAVFQWQELKIYLFSHQAMKPLDIYANLLSSRPDSLKHILVLVELMLSLSPSTAKCERCFGYEQNKNEFEDSNGAENLVRSAEDQRNGL